MVNEKEVPVGILLMAYGSPENISEVAPYYTHIRSGVRPPEELIKNLTERYRMVGGKTPLHAITRQQAAALQSLLDEKEGRGKFAVFIGMKHWHPYIKSALDEMRAQDIETVIAIALAPHYSRISIGGYDKALKEASMTTEMAGQKRMAVQLIESWYDNRHLIDCIAAQVRDSLSGIDANPYILFTAHSLPEKIRTWNDPYETQLMKTAQMVAERLPGMHWGFSFQSAGMTSEPWIGPDLNDRLLALKRQGKNNILVCPIGFVSDNLEIVFDIDIESKELAMKHGITLRRTESRNVHPLFIDALYDLVKNQV